MDVPTFPTHLGSPKGGDNVNISGFGLNSWETTYKSNLKQFDSAPRTQEYDTVTLQKTHWTTGNISDEMVSENHSTFRPIPPQKVVQGRTRDQLMATTFSLGNGYPMETRESLNHQCIVSQKDSEKRKKMDIPNKSSITISQNIVNDWRTTTKDSYTPYKDYKSPEIIQKQLNDGEGTRETLMNQRTNHDYSTESQSNYISHKQNNRSSSVDQTKLKKSSVVVGDTGNHYSTTHQDAFCDKQADVIESQKAKQTRVAFGKSGFKVGSNMDPIEKTTYEENFVDYGGYKPPTNMPKTAFISHHEFRNCNDTFKTSTQEAYTQYKLTPPPPAEIHLNDVHIPAGDQSFHQLRSLYQDTFIPQKQTHQTIDFSKTKAFHTQHHTNVTTIAGLQDVKSVSQSTYVPHSGIRPRSPIRNDSEVRVVSMSDPSLVIKESTMKKDFVPFSSNQNRHPVNNELQASHIQIKGETNEKWTTSQGDYFKFTTYQKAK